MVKLTMIARVTDGLPLAEGLDDGRDQKDSDFYKQQAKLLLRTCQRGNMKPQGCQLRPDHTFSITSLKAEYVI